MQDLIEVPLILMLYYKEEAKLLITSENVSEYLNKNQIITELRIDRYSLLRKTLSRLFFVSHKFFLSLSLPILSFSSSLIKDCGL